jgi:predicted ABC-type sugar transport system permease subunit
MRTDLKARKAHIIHWAAGCSLASVLLLVSTIFLFVATFCLESDCHNPPIMNVLFSASVLWFLAAGLATVALSIWALVLHRQSP